MKSKHDVKYLIVAMTVSLATSTTLSASEVIKASELTSATSIVETLQPVAFVETEKVNIPVLAEPIVIAEDNDISDKSKNIEDETEQVVETESTSLIPNEPMPIPENKTNSYIPLLEGAVIFANFDDALPAVVNYYIQLSEQEIIDFYQQSFGDAITQDRKRGRLTLTYQSDDLLKRVVISEQNGKRQVDVIVEQATR